MRIREYGSLKLSPAGAGGVHPYHELLYIEAGVTELQWMDRRSTLPAPCLIAIPADTPHWVTPRGSFVTGWFLEADTGEVPFLEYDVTLRWNQRQSRGEGASWPAALSAAVAGVAAVVEAYERGEWEAESAHRLLELDIRKLLLLIRLAEGADAAAPASGEPPCSASAARTPEAPARSALAADASDSPARSASAADAPDSPTRSALAADASDSPARSTSASDASGSPTRSALAAVDPQLYTALRYMERSFARNITLEELSGICHRTPSYVIRLFKQAFGTTPMQYLQELRLRAAIRYLATTDKPIQEIAEITGFSNLHYFSRMFKKKVGESPSAWRQRQRSGLPPT